MDAEFFLQPRLGSSARITWRRVLLPDLGSSSSHRFELSLRSREKINEGKTSPSQVTTLNTMMRTGYMVFINMNLNLFSD